MDTDTSDLERLRDEYKTLGIRILKFNAILNQTKLSTIMADAFGNPLLNNDLSKNMSSFMFKTIPGKIAVSSMITTLTQVQSILNTFLGFLMVNILQEYLNNTPYEEQGKVIAGLIAFILVVFFSMTSNICIHYLDMRAEGSMQIMNTPDYF